MRSLAIKCAHALSIYLSILPKNSAHGWTDAAYRCVVARCENVLVGIFFIVDLCVYRAP